MGGRKNKGWLGSLAKGVVSDVVGAASLGTVDVNNQKINLNPEDAASNFMSSSTGMNSISGLSGPTPELPKAEDPTEQALRAKAEADAAVAKELNLKNGLAQNTTILGGSLGDSSNLRKKKLLGE
jgi:hypothetical protein